MDTKHAVPIWEKYALTIKEASQYFHIGENKIRRIIDDDPSAEYILWNGNRAQLKRRKFEEFLDRCGAI